MIDLELILNIYCIPLLFISLDFASLNKISEVYRVNSAWKH